MGKLTDKIQVVQEKDNIVSHIDDPVNMPALIQKIADVVSKDRWQSKGDNISHENVLGMIQANNFNKYVEEALGKEFRITLLDALISDKMMFVQSVGGTGNKNIKAALGTMQPVVTSNMAPTIIESLAQKPNERIKRE